MSYIQNIFQLYGFATITIKIDFFKKRLFKFIISMVPSIPDLTTKRTADTLDAFLLQINISYFVRQ